MKVRREKKEEDPRIIETVVGDMEAKEGDSGDMDSAFACMEEGHTRPFDVEQYLEEGRIVLRVIVHVEKFGITCKKKCKEENVNVESEKQDAGVESGNELNLEGKEKELRSQVEKMERRRMELAAEEEIWEEKMRKRKLKAEERKKKRAVRSNSQGRGRGCFKHVVRARGSFRGNGRGNPDALVGSRGKSACLSNSRGSPRSPQSCRGSPKSPHSCRSSPRSPHSCRGSPRSPHSCRGSPASARIIVATNGDRENVKGEK